MARKLRFEGEGAIYHVINRGNYRSWIFESEGAKVSFEKTLFEACEYAGWILHGYVVMGNHYHLALETPQANLSEGMRWLQSVFSIRFNRFRKERGRLFQGRFKSLPVEDSERLAWLCHYIHLNPVRAGICSLKELSTYRHGSYWYLRNKRQRPSELQLGQCLEGAGGLKDTRRGWTQYEQYLEWLCEDEPAQKRMAFDKMSKGWALGSQAFKASLVKEEKVMHAAVELGLGDAKEARELAWKVRLGECLEFLGKTKGDLEAGAKSAEWKVGVAAHLKTRLLCRNGWIGEALSMGAESGVSRLVTRCLKGEMKRAGKVRVKLNAQFKE